jgi:hypothetical protein
VGSPQAQAAQAVAGRGGHPIAAATAFPADHVVNDTRAFTDGLLADLVQEGGLSTAARRDIEVIVTDHLAPRGQLDDGAWAALDLRELPARLRPAEAGPDHVFHVPASLVDRIDAKLERARLRRAASRLRRGAVHRRLPRSAHSRPGRRRSTLHARPP